jgi:large subunit ribosomal protein L4
MEDNSLFDTLTEKDVDEKKAVYIIHRAFVTQKKNKWQHTSSTKTRSEVAGGGRKPWKQKGTGRARAGSNTSPLWKGGGVSFGPKPKNVFYKLNKKEKQLALKLVLRSKQRQIKLIENFENLIAVPKTRDFIKSIEILGINPTSQIGLILPQVDKKIYLATRNLKNIILMLSSSLNVEDLLRVETIITTKDSLNLISTFYSKV